MARPGVTKHVPGHQAECRDGFPLLPGCFLGTVSPPCSVTSLQAWEPQTGTPCSSIPARVSWVWRPHLPWCAGGWDEHPILLGQGQQQVGKDKY